MRSIHTALVIAASMGVLLSCASSPGAGGSGAAGGQGGSGAHAGAGGTGEAGGSGGQGGAGGTGGEGGTGGAGGSGGTGGGRGASTYVKPSDTSAFQAFGASIAVSSDGSTLAVGATNELSATLHGVGEVYVFVRAGDTWVQQAHLVASNLGAGDAFGQSLALSADGGTLAVGADLEDSNATGIDGNQTNDSARSSGAAYIFRRTGSTWAQEAYVKASNTDANDLFGFAVALSGDGETLAVGAILESSSATGVNGDQTDNGVRDSGAVYLFSSTGGSWSQRAYLKASNTGEEAMFGYSVSLSADGATLAVGAKGESSSATGVDGDQGHDGAAGSGAVYVFTRAADAWTQQAYVKASNTDGSDMFGWAVSVSRDGSTLAVGAPGEASSASGIGANQADDSADLTGAVYLFARTGTSWTQQVYIKASNPDELDRFGNAVSLSADGATLAVGAPHESSSGTGLNANQADNSGPGAGAVYLFRLEAGTWSQQGYIKASNTGPGDAFGQAVSLSAGGVLAVGAWFEDSSATGIDGDQADNGAQHSGAAYLY